MYNHRDGNSMLHIFTSLITGAMKQQAPLKEVFIRTQKPKKRPISKWFEDEYKCLLKNQQML